MTSRGGAVVARWAHNPKVTGSSPVPATKNDIRINRVSFIFYPDVLSVRLLVWKLSPDDGCVDFFNWDDIVRLVD